MGFRRAFKRKSGGAYIRGAYNRTEKKNFKTSYIWIQVHLHLSGSTPPPPGGQTRTHIQNNFPEIILILSFV